jgi:hypothetical protein
MKSFFMASFLLSSPTIFATVVEMDVPAESVFEVYEEMREDQQDVPDNRWIHEFETDSVGPEMDHLSRLKDISPSQNQL